RAPVGAASLDARFFCELQLQTHAAVGDLQEARSQLELAPSRQQARALAQRSVTRRVERPEALSRRPDPNLRGAHHQLLIEHAHPAPALQGTAEREHAAPGDE